MAKIIMDLDIDIEKLQDRLKEELDKYLEGSEYPKNTEEIIEFFSELYFTDFANIIDNENEDFTVTKFEFESKAEKKDFEDWLKKKGKEEDSDDEDEEED